MSPGVHEFCIRESRAALVGTLLAQSTRIMSPPANIWAAEHKIHQLTTAKAAGLDIPATVITNDPDEIRRAFSLFAGNMIIKPVRTGFVDCDGEQRAIYTSRVLESHMSQVESARLSPAIVQPLIDKRCDVRVTAVGTKLFVAEIDSQGDPAAAVDWRRTENPNLPHRRATLPEGVENSIRRLLNNLGLVFGALDLVRTPDDRYVFLEVNPNGQWVWMDDMLDLGISAAVAAWLLGDED